MFETSFYFSAMTLFSVGNGDVIPQGIGRIIAVVEALIGYTFLLHLLLVAFMERNKVVRQIVVIVRRIFVRLEEIIISMG